MNEQTLAALTQLATKLGTNAEYLWGVLITQAPITATMDLFVLIAWVIPTIWWIMYVKRKTTRPAEGYADWGSDDTQTVFSWGSIIILIIGIAFAASCTIPNAITAFINPEYWALMQILR